MNNPLSFMKAFRNPQEFLQKAIGNQELMSNPIAKNALNLAQQGDIKGLEEMARNMCKERNTQPEDVINQVKSMFGM